MRKTYHVDFWYAAAWAAYILNWAFWCGWMVRAVLIGHH